MKKFVLLFLLSFALHLSFAQSDANTLHDKARILMQQGDFDNALLTLDSALQLQPGDIEILKDISYTNYLNRDYAKAIETGKIAISKPDADVQSFQVLGLAYKAIADKDNADKMYKTALKKFPKSGVLYSEYGDLLDADKNSSGAIKLWEKGIEADPNAGGNYYYAAKYYAENGNMLWSLIYGETFVNIESFTKRTQEMKILIWEGYKKLFANSGAIITTLAKTGSGFEKAVAQTLSKLKTMMDGELTPESITALRTRFILEWFDKNAVTFPFRLFDHQRLLLQLGYFDAYNQWLTGSAFDTDKLQAWMDNHPDEVAALQQFQRNVLYKIPAGQYYPHTY